MRQINTALKYRYARKVAVIDRFEWLRDYDHCNQLPELSSSKQRLPTVTFVRFDASCCVLSVNHLQFFLPPVCRNMFWSPQICCSPHVHAWSWNEELDISTTFLRPCLCLLRHCPSTGSRQVVPKRSVSWVDSTLFWCCTAANFKLSSSYFYFHIGVKTWL
jgi:hypothetical protein